MKKLKVIISKFEKSYEGACKIKESCNICTEIIYIEDFIDKGLLLGDDDIVHFSCNSDHILPIINKNLNKNCYIFNKDYLLRNFSKLEVQKLLESNGVKVPRIYEKYDDAQMPIFCKENRHIGILFQAYRKDTLDKFFSKFNIEDFYFEESLTYSKNTIKEFKVYYAHGNFFGNYDKLLFDKINDICQRINKTFPNIEIYSIDFILLKNELYLIDLNPAVGFYLSNEGRNAFLKRVDELSKL